ncbi:hypothetical protein [Jiulongibacter sp. NS-SX5]|uniref:hypothetical protein n=1 Tax=Jiulongibacter sp. NS-SX5 TaxID=3463854 RepID=UPI004059A76D
MLNPIEFVISNGRFEFSEPELQNMDISHFHHYMTSSGIKQFRVVPDETFKSSFWKTFAATKSRNTPENWIDLKELFDLFEVCFPGFDVTYHRRIEEFAFEELLLKTPIGLSNNEVEKLLDSCHFDSLFY